MNAPSHDVPPSFQNHTEQLLEAESSTKRKTAESSDRRCAEEVFEGSWQARVMALAPSFLLILLSNPYGLPNECRSTSVLFFDFRTRNRRGTAGSVVRWIPPGCVPPTWYDWREGPLPIRVTEGWILRGLAGVCPVRMAGKQSFFDIQH